MLISKKYCHLILNNDVVLAANAALFEKYKPIFRYLYGYAWFTLYTEETILKTQVTTNDRFVFNIETASLLPVYPNCADSPYMSPYFSVAVSDDLLNIGQNIVNVPPFT